MADVNTQGLGALKPIETSQENFSLDEFHMKPTFIAKVEIIETTKGWVDGKFVEQLPVPQKQLYVESAVLKIVKNSEGKEIPIVAREWLNLITKSDGTIGWSTDERGSVNKMLKAHKVKHPSELISKPCIIKVVDKTSKTDGSKVQVIRFVY